MADIIYEAPPMSRQAIIDVTTAIREIFLLEDSYLPIDRLLEHYLPVATGIEFEILGKREMGNRHGFWDAAQRRLVLRSDVYEGLCAGKGRDRMTGCSTSVTRTASGAPSCCSRR